MSKIGEWWKSLFGRDVVPNQAEHGHTSEVGYRPTMERRARLENPLFAVDYEYRAVVADPAAFARLRVETLLKQS